MHSGETELTLHLGGRTFATLSAFLMNVLCCQLDENAPLFLFSIEATGFLHIFRIMQSMYYFNVNVCK